MKKTTKKYFSEDLLKNVKKHTALENMYTAQDISADKGFDFSSIEVVMTKVEEEFKELKEAFNNRENDFEHFIEELGDCYFALVNLARHAKRNPERIAEQNVVKYLKRCIEIEKWLKKENKVWEDLNYGQIAALWKKIKANGF